MTSFQQIEANRGMHSRAPVPTPKLANGGHGDNASTGIDRRNRRCRSGRHRRLSSIRRAQKTDIRAHVKHRRSFSETPLPLLESSQRPQEIDSSKRWPIHVREIELAEHTLP